MSDQFYEGLPVRIPAEVPEPGDANTVLHIAAKIVRDKKPTREVIRSIVRQGEPGTPGELFMLVEEDVETGARRGLTPVVTRLVIEQVAARILQRDERTMSWPFALTVAAMGAAMAAIVPREPDPAPVEPPGFGPDPEPPADTEPAPREYADR